jgi:hypothetical protein
MLRKLPQYAYKHTHTHVIHYFSNSIIHKTKTESPFLSEEKGEILYRKKKSSLVVGLCFFIQEKKKKGFRHR